jgi:hypothetical protein
MPSAGRSASVFRDEGKRQVRYRRETNGRGRGGPGDELGDRTPARRLHLVALALLVLVVGVAGSASAAVLIGSRQVKDGSLTGHDLRRGTVRSSDVRDHSLKPRDFDVIPQGPTGPQGAPGDPGTNGSPGAAAVTVTRTILGKTTATIVVPCTPPQKAVFGGSFLPVQVDTMQSAPEIDGSAWGFVIRNRSSFDQTVTLQANCVTDR